MYLIAGIPILLVLIFFAVSHFVNRDAGGDRDTANCLVVLSGVLAALAILVPLGATLMPDAKDIGWTGWFLAGALVSGAVCLFGTVFCMIKLQGTKQFKPKEKRFIPGWINATWIALGMLALAVVLIKVAPAARHAATDPATLPGTRFAVARDLPLLGSTRDTVEKEWGTPAVVQSKELRYRTRDGSVIFCLDGGGLTRSITETQEADLNAIGKVCGQN
jgi:hypothetical protein